MNERERLLQKIKRVQALALRGVSGEKESAAAMLDKLMKQYGISESDIAEEHREIAWFRFKTPLEEKLLFQVIYSVVGNRGVYERKNRNTKKKYKMQGVECTPAERLEIELSYEFFKAAMETEIERFFRAFVNKNHIFPSPDKVKQQDSTADPPPAAELFKTQMMMAGMDEYTRRAALESGAAE